MSESTVSEKPASGTAAALGLGNFSREPRGLGQTKGGDGSLSIDAVMRIPVTVQVVLGSTTMPVSNLMKLTQGSIVALDNKVGEPVDVVVNGRVVARGELVVMDDDNTRFGISLTEIVGAPEQGKAG
jgi:flagellar motor switch protein FliN/FliY